MFFEHVTIKFSLKLLFENVAKTVQLNSIHLKIHFQTSQQKSGAVTAVCFTVDSMFVVSGSAQGSISLWEASSGALTKQFDLHSNPIVEIVCFADGNNVLTVDDHDAAFIWALAALEDPSQIEVLSSFAGLRAPVFVRLDDSIVISQNVSNVKE